MLRLSKQLLIGTMVILMAYQPAAARAEAIDDKYSSTKDDTGFVHGKGYGKVLMRILIFGSIPKQGVHYMPEGTDLLFGILYAGGYGEESKLNGITIRRRKVGKLMEIDLEDVIAAGDEIPKLQDGDIVNVPFNWRKTYQDVTFITTVLTAVSSLILSVVALTAITKKN
jgi:hypothetical protein